MRQWEVRLATVARLAQGNTTVAKHVLLCGALCTAIISMLGLSTAESAPAERTGLTMILSGGLGYSRVTQGDDESFHSPVIGPLSASVGGFMHRNWALQLRAGTHWFANRDETESKRWFSNIFFGSELQHWIRNNVAISAGVGLTIIVTEPIEINADRGLGMSVRGAWAFKTNQNNAFSIAWELRPSIFRNNEVILDSLVLLEWQRL